MIRKPNDDELYQLKQHLGPTVLNFFLELIDTVNQHLADNERHNNYPCYEEADDAQRPTPIDRGDSGLSGPEPGK